MKKAKSFGGSRYLELCGDFRGAYEAAYDCEDLRIKDHVMRLHRAIDDADRDKSCIDADVTWAGLASEARYTWEKLVPLFDKLPADHADIAARESILRGVASVASIASGKRPKQIPPHNPATTAPRPVKHGAKSPVPPKSPGRKPSYSEKDQKRIIEAWDVGNYRTYRELKDALNLTMKVDVIGRIIDADNKRRKRAILKDRQ